MKGNFNTRFWASALLTIAAILVGLVVYVMVSQQSFSAAVPLLGGVGGLCVVALMLMTYPWPPRKR